MASLVAEDVGHRFGTLLLFRHMSFSVSAGETLAVTGANGAGKSTLLRILAGVLAPKAGSISLTVDGDDVGRDRRPQYVGLVAPGVGVYGDLTAQENLAFLSQVARLSNAEERIDRVLQRIGLADRADDSVSTFSSGMRQRLKYGAALLTDPVLLLLDEPSANLDAEGRELVEDVVTTQRRNRRLLVVATNRREEAERHDRILRLEDYCDDSV